MIKPTLAKVAILSSVHAALDNRVFYREAQTLAKAGYEVTLVAVHHQDETKDGIRIKALPRVSRSRRPLLWRGILREAIATGADVFHIHDPELLLLTPWLRRKTGKPTIYDVHEANADFLAVKDYLPKAVRMPLAVLFRRLEPRLAGGESGLIFADDAIARDFSAYHGHSITLFNFPRQDLITEGALVPPLPEREPVVLYLGGMERNRGSSLMVEAFARVVSNMPQARLWVVGHFTPADLEDEVRADIAKRDIEHAVRLVGRVPFEQIGSYLSSSAVGWVAWQPFAKNQKNIPTKLFEYMAFGLPVVSSGLSSIKPYVYQEQNGLLVDATDPLAHAAALLSLLQNPVVAAEMGQTGRAWVESRWNWAQMAPRLLNFYEAVLKDHH
jgi:glycosyltransferase involved in cell wall biosynthesis